MDRTIDTATTRRCTIGRVDDGIHGQRRDVSVYNLHALHALIASAQRCDKLQGPLRPLAHADLVSFVALLSGPLRVFPTVERAAG